MTNKDVKELLGTVRELTLRYEKTGQESNIIDAQAALEIAAVRIIGISNFWQKSTKVADGWTKWRKYAKSEKEVMKTTEELYHRIAAVYETERTRVPFFRLEERNLRPLLPELKGKRVLDVGCGTGRWTKYFVKSGADVTSVDTSPDMLALARRRVKGAQFKLMDARKLRFPDNSFDFVFESLVLNHLKDFKRVVREMIRVARPGGWIITSDFHGSSVGGRPAIAPFITPQKFHKSLAIKIYPLYPSDIVAEGIKLCEIADIKELRAPTILEPFGFKKNFMPWLFIIKLRKR